MAVARSPASTPGPPRPGWTGRDRAVEAQAGGRRALPEPRPAPPGRTTHAGHPGPRPRARGHLLACRRVAAPEPTKAASARAVGVGCAHAAAGAAPVQPGAASARAVGVGCAHAAAGAAPVQPGAVAPTAAGGLLPQPLEGRGEAAPAPPGDTPARTVPGHAPPCPHRGRGWPPRQRLGRAVVRHGWAAAQAPGPGICAPWPGRRARASVGQQHTPCAMAGRRTCAAEVSCTHYAEVAAWGPRAKAVPARRHGAASWHRRGAMQAKSVRRREMPPGIGRSRCHGDDGWNRP
jgi:hypothetical protein